jgi:hypothetical protein
MWARRLDELLDTYGIQVYDLVGIMACRTLLTDLHGFATGFHKSFAYYTSKDGLSYELVSKVPLFTNQIPIRFADGSEEKFLRIERPNVVLDEQGAVIAILAACTPENQRDGSRILVFPVDRFGAKPPKPNP